MTATQLTVAEFQKAVDPDVPHWAELGKAKEPSVYQKVYNVEKSDQAWESLASWSGFGTLRPKGPSENLQFDKIGQGPVATYMHTTYGLACAVNKELIEDGRGFDFIQKSMTAMGDASRRTYETLCAQVLDEGFDSGSLTGPNGKRLLADDHTTRVGTYSNILADPSDLNYDALEAMHIQIANIPDDRGNQGDVKLKNLIIHRQNVFNAERLLASTQQPGEFSNDVNAFKSLNVLQASSVVVWDYLDASNASAWYCQTNEQSNQGLTLYIRKGLEFDDDKMIQSGGIIYTGSQRQMICFGNQRAIVGSPGQ